MTLESAAGAQRPPDDLAGRLERACRLVSRDAELVGAVWLLGLPGGDAALAAIEAAERTWPVRITLFASAEAPTLDLVVRGRLPVDEVGPRRRAGLRALRRRRAHRKEQPV